MRALIKHFVRICAETLPILEPIYEFGSLQVPGQEGFADLRPFFPGRSYVGTDMRPGFGVDAVFNLTSVALPAESVGTALSLDTFEHVEYTREAIQEMHRILKPDGILVISSHMKFPVHSHPYDYWRFTTEGFRSLLKPFSSSFVESAGQNKLPHTVIGIGFKGTVPDQALKELARRMSEWKPFWRFPLLRIESYTDWLKTHRKP